MSELSSLHKDQTLGSLEKQLICPICLEIFTKPVVILPCQHNLCRKCANELYQVGVGGRFRCPSCRHEVVLDRHGVYGLQRNLLVENIIDVYKQECASSKAQSKPTIYPTCEEHEGEKVNIYCITCKVPTCSLCKVFGAHKTCQVAPIPEVYQQQKAELSDGIGSLVATNDRVQAVISELEEVRRNIEENGRTLKQTLCEKFDRMHAILEERRKIMTQQITYEQEGKSGHARSVLDTCREHVEANMKLVETSLHIMEKSDMAAFLKESRSLIQRVNDVSNSYTVETVEPGFERMDHYKVDFDEEERALHQLDFIKLEEEVEEGLDDAEPEPDNENAFEYELEQELEPDADTISTLDLNPDRDQEMKTGPFGIKDPVLEEREDMHKEGLTGPTKQAKCESEGMSTQQGEPGSWHGEHDAGGQGNQGEDMKLYPSWYRASGWQMVSPGLAMVREHQAIPDCIPQMGQEAPSQSQVQTPQTRPMPLWVGTSFRPVAADHMTNQFGGGSLVGPQGSGSLATENTEQGDRPTSRGLVAPISPQMDSSLSSSPVEGPPLSHTTVSGRQCLLLSTSTSISPQAVTFCFYLVALLVILQRVWGHIQCIIST